MQESILNSQDPGLTGIGYGLHFPCTIVPLHHRYTGFSLLELVMVLSIVVILAAVAAPRFASANARYRADFAARRVAADLSLAQTHARSTGTSVTVRFGVDQNRYTLVGVEALDGSGDYSVNLDQSPYLATLASAEFGDDGDLIFNGWGKTDSAGTLTLTVGHETRTLDVNSPSGEVTIQ